MFTLSLETIRSKREGGKQLLLLLVLVVVILGPLWNDFLTWTVYNIPIAVLGYGDIK